MIVSIYDDGGFKEKPKWLREAENNNDVYKKKKKKERLNDKFIRDTRERKK